MRKLPYILVLMAIFLGANPVNASTCYGHSPCKACKTCEYCKHCAKLGGTCGVCAHSKSASKSRGQDKVAVSKKDKTS